jgi:hypothetical protein
MPRIVRLGLVPRAGVKDHSGAYRYCEVVMRESMRACSAKVMSLNWTVGVRPWLRAAYWARMSGE